MSLARIHDKYRLRKFWEQKIANHGQMVGNEEIRMKRSALSKLREEWIQRLEIQTRHLKAINEEHEEG
ncbi:protein FAM240C-like [Anguilla anguilla]|uniref:protein FAM240C-like n=1 Tax=Anguilla anguilla TaxID=7936 RepID=UPI0015AE9D5A|nr:protein FAM240C-like [Anguilla anguilla]